MRINQNLAAFNAYRNLSATQGNLSSSLEKLSSGFRINRAADDASGLVNSESLRAQIGGLKVATRNAQDAISMVQTAEGAQSEAHAILQRMRDLAVEAGNLGVNDAEALKANQDEISQLRGELDRINADTQFGTRAIFPTLASGEAAAAGTPDVEASQQATLSGDDDLHALWARLTATASAQINADRFGDGGIEEVRFTINGVGYTADLSGDVDDIDAVVAALNAAVDDEGQTLADQEVGEWRFSLGRMRWAGAYLATTRGTLELAAADAAALGFEPLDFRADGWMLPLEVRSRHHIDRSQLTAGTELSVTVNGETFTVELEEGDNESLATLVERLNLAVGDDDTAAITEVATWTFEQPPGTLVLTTAGDDENLRDEVSFPVETGELLGFAADYRAEAQRSAFGGVGPGGGEPGLGDGSDGSFGFQVGANPFQGVQVRVTQIDASTLGLDDIDVLAGDDAAERIATAIETIDAAIAMVSENRAELGGFQNRMESTIRNLSVAVENLSAAESRIRDTDMAMEMVEFTRNQILSQAGTAMLAQANVIPQSILSLLG